MKFNHAHELHANDPRIANRTHSQRRDAYHADERYARDVDVSGSWREEYSAQGVDPDGHELVTDGGADVPDRPDDCICWDDENTLPCFPCRRDGFGSPNPSEPEADTDVDSYPATIDDSADSPTAVATATDGGTTSTPAFDIPEPGAVVHDREDTTGDDRLLVLGVREETDARSEYIEQLDASVAEVNPQYSPHAPVARCVYYEEVATVDPQADIDDVRSAVALDIFNSYTFPVDRLALGDVDAAGGDDQ